MNKFLIRAQEKAVEQYARLRMAQQEGATSYEFFARSNEIAVTNQILLLLVRGYDEDHPSGR